MSEREGGDWPSEGKPVAAELSERIRSILADAEAAADALRHQADQDAAARRRAAETEALKIIEDARREAERFLADRIAAVSQLSDELLERGQGVVERLDEAERVRSELAGLVNSLGETAARLANEVRAMPGPRVPDIAAAPARPEPEQQPRQQAPAVAAPEPVAAGVEEPEPEPAEPEPVAAEPEPEPTPIRPAIEEPNPIELAPVEPAAEETTEPEAEAAEAGAAEPEPTPEEIELLERVRAAERERSGEDVPEPEEDPQKPSADANGAGDLVEVTPSAGETAEHPDAEAGDQALGARLVALQMAVAGGNRGEVEAHLRRAFELDEPGAILDDIFGSGTDSDKRVVWPEAAG
jgi:hypothetical protein